MLDGDWVSGAGSRLFAVDPLVSESRGDGRSLQENASRIGRVAELRAITILLERGFRVAVPVVDDDGVDLIVEYGVTVQVKAKSRRLVTGNYGFGLGVIKDDYVRGGRRVRRRRHRVADVFIFYGGEDDAWWVIPSNAIQESGGFGVQSISLSVSPMLQTRYSDLASRYRDAWWVFDGES